MPSKKNKPIVFLFGPTASGKTELAINIADKFPIELISVDSVMVYKDCNIGSAKPTKEVLKEYPHHMIDIVSPNEVFTVADFCSFSKKLIKSAHSKKKLPVFVGGSMMYFKSLFEGIHDLPKRDEKYRKELKELKLNSNNHNFLFDMLKDIDSDYAKKVNKNDEVRIIRALEVFMITGIVIILSISNYAAIRKLDIVLRGPKNSTPEKVVSTLENIEKIKAPNDTTAIIVLVIKKINTSSYKMITN